MDFPIEKCQMGKRQSERRETITLLKTIFRVKCGFIVDI